MSRHAVLDLHLPVCVSAENWPIADGATEQPAPVPTCRPLTSFDRLYCFTRIKMAHFVSV